MVKVVSTVRHNRGLSVEDALGVSEVARILGVHPRTIERRRRASKAPRPLQAQREEKLRTIWQELVGLFGAENAIYWLQHPVPALGERRPIEIMLDDGGLDRVLETVGRMSWGIPT
jgi:putative toxin-antitoxin system antitoxin component (TIGR02293 family)